MLRHVWIRIKRKPLIFVAILLFTAIIALALCGLHSGNDTALEKYNDIYYKIDVRCTVTNLAGDQSDRLNIQSGTIALFTGSMDAAPAVLSDLVEDVQVKGATEIVWNGEVYTLMGITSTKVDSKLWPEMDALSSGMTESMKVCSAVQGHSVLFRRTWKRKCRRLICQQIAFYLA